MRITDADLGSVCRTRNWKRGKKAESSAESSAEFVRVKFHIDYVDVELTRGFLSFREGSNFGYVGLPLRLYRWL